MSDKEAVIESVIYTRDGTALPMKSRPGTMEDYFREVDEIRKQYSGVFEKLDRFSMDDYIAEKRIEAEREWRE